MFACDEGNSPRQNRFCFSKVFHGYKMFLTDRFYVHKDSALWMQEWMVIGVGVCEHVTSSLLDGELQLKLCPCAIVRFKNPLVSSGFGLPCVCALNDDRELIQFYLAMGTGGHYRRSYINSIVQYCKDVAVSDGYPLLGPYIRRDCN